MTIERKGIFLCPQKASKEPPALRIPRIAKLMKLAIRLDQPIRDGVGVDQAELALRVLEEILHLPACERGRDQLTERQLNPIAAAPSWTMHKRLYQSIVSVNLQSTDLPETQTLAQRL